MQLNYLYLQKFLTIVELSFEKTILPHIGKTAKYAGYYFNSVLHENGIDLTKEQWLVLKKLNEKDGIVQNELAFISDRSKTALTRIINTMEKKNYLNRVHSKTDKRLNHIFLTEKGKAIFKKSLPVLQKLILELQKGVTQEELEHAINVLNKIEANIHKHQSN